jgi:release factor glutamine methyltransferase
MAKTYQDLYLDGRKMLNGADIEGAALEARELLCHVTGKTKDELLRDGRLYAFEDIESQYHQLLERRIAGEPAAYLIGEWSFCDLTLEVNPSVLIPRIDTEVIAERVMDVGRSMPPSCRVLDLCTGSGCIGLAVAAHVDESRVVLADWSEEALAVAHSNARRNHLNNAVCVRVNALEEPPEMLGSFDIIVSNPPYIPTDDIAGLDCSVRDYEPHMALDGGTDGLDFYRNIISRWKSLLRPGGMMIFEVGYNQADAVEQLMVEQGFQNIDTIADTQNIWRSVEGWL